jgi:hypothetical protein
VRNADSKTSAPERKCDSETKLPSMMYIAWKINNDIPAGDENKTR